MAGETEWFYGPRQKTLDPAAVGAMAYYTLPFFKWFMYHGAFFHFLFDFRMTAPAQITGPVAQLITVITGMRIVAMETIFLFKRRMDYPSRESLFN